MPTSLNGRYVYALARFLLQCKLTVLEVILKFQFVKKIGQGLHQRRLLECRVTAAGLLPPAVPPARGASPVLKV